MPSGYLSRRTNISDPLAKSLATSLTSLRMSAPFTTLIRPTTSRIPPVHVTTRSTLWQTGSDTILSRSGLLQGRNVRRLLALMANRPAFPSRIWPHLVKIRGIEDLGSQPTKHPSWSWLPARPRLLSTQVRRHPQVCKPKQPRIPSPKNISDKKPPTGQGQKWRGTTPILLIMRHYIDMAV